MDKNCIIQLNIICTQHKRNSLFDRFQHFCSCILVTDAYIIKSSCDRYEKVFFRKYFYICIRFNRICVIASQKQRISLGPPGPVEMHYIMFNRKLGYMICDNSMLRICVQELTYIHKYYFANHVKHKSRYQHSFPIYTYMYVFNAIMQLYSHNNNTHHSRKVTPIYPRCILNVCQFNHLFTTCPYMDRVAASRYPLISTRAELYETSIRYAEIITYAVADWS